MAGVDITDISVDLLRERFPNQHFFKADISRGLPSITIVGLADAAIKESKERVKAAIKNSGFGWPQERITVSLAPSSIRKEGSSFDLAIALGILAASQQINTQNLLMRPRQYRGMIFSRSYGFF